MWNLPSNDNDSMSIHMRTCKMRTFTTNNSNNERLTIPSWATLDPQSLGVIGQENQNDIHHVHNLVLGKWQSESRLQSQSQSNSIIIPNPMNKNAPPICTVPDTRIEDLTPFVDSMKRVPKSGLHNPLKNVERYLMYADISRKAGEALAQPDIQEFFTQCIMKTVPKSHAQAKAEVTVTTAFLQNFAGDNVRYLAKSFSSPGDHVGQECKGYRWPHGAVAIIAPFNFPLEIPVLQLMGSLFMGNKPLLKPSEKVSLVMEQFIRLLHHVGMPMDDVDLLNCHGSVVEELIVGNNNNKNSPIVRLTQFTGSSRVAEHLSHVTNGRVKIEDAGFDWKILGPDARVQDVNYVAWQCDQDAYACQGQKCSAQSILFIHDNWAKMGIMDKIKENASCRTLDDLTIGPVLTNTTLDILQHVQKLLEIPGSKLLFGGKELVNHDIPDIYGAVEPTAVYVPLKQMLKDEYFDTCTTELFAPFQVITTYGDNEVESIIDACERMSHHLTAALVSNDVHFQQKILGNTVNGTTYVGSRARTTGAPQNHWFGPAGDTRGAGIGTAEAIQMVWSCHREIIHDSFIPDDWVQPKAT